MLDRFERLLASRRVPVAAVIVDVVLFLPALGVGLFADDLTHQSAFDPSTRLPGGIRGDWDIFRFQSADRQNLRQMMDLGIWPWWAAPSLQLAFFRPLTSLSHALDYRVVRVPWVMHAENLALFAGIVFAAAWIYRRLLTLPAVAGLAALLFAVDHAHYLPVSWVGHRNALFSALFGLVAVAAHDRARRDGDRLAAVAAPLLYGAGLLGGEAAVATLAYLVAHAIFVDEAPVRSRLAALVPFAVVTLAWTAVYRGLGYGAVGSGYYIDPGSEPVAFARALVIRLPILLLAQLTGPPADLWTQIQDRRVAAPLAAAIAVLVPIVIVMARVLRGDRRAAFFAVGGLLSLVPVCATLPNDRLLLFSSLGAFGVIALFLARLREAAAARPRGARLLGGVLLFVHLIASPLLVPVRTISTGAVFRGYVARAERGIPSRADPASTVVILNAPDLLIANYATSGRIDRGQPIAAPVRVLGTVLGDNAVELERPDARTLVMTVRDGLLDDAFSTLARSAKAPFHVGERVEVAGMTAEVEALTPDARPRRVRFRFDRALDDPTMRWISWEGRGFVPAAVPAVGERAKLAGIDWYAAVMPD